MEKTKQKMTQKEWLDMGAELFGADVLDWEFVCPACGHVQKPKDFLPYFKNKNEAINIAYFNCIGRYNGAGNTMFSKKQTCNYTTGGFLNISPVTVIRDDGTEGSAFDFNKK